MMGVTFASVGPMLAMAATPEVGLLGIYGSVIAAGIFGIFVAPFVSRLLPLFPPVVTGTIIMVIGISLMRVGINWAGGGLPSFTRVINGETVQVSNPAYGSIEGLAIAGFVLLVILASDQMGQGLRRQCRGSAWHHRRRLCWPRCWGRCILTRSPQPRGSVFVLSVPFRHAAIPDLFAIVTMCIVMIVVMIESPGMFLALGDMTGARSIRPR